MAIKVAKDKKLDSNVFSKKNHNSQLIEPCPKREVAMKMPTILKKSQQSQSQINEKTNEIHPQEVKWSVVG